MMKRLICALVVVGVGVVCLGFYLGWFNVGSTNSDGKSKVTLSVDTDKIHADEQKAVDKVTDLGHQMKDKVAGSSQNTMDGTVVSLSSDKLTMTGKDGKEHAHKLAANVTVTCDG